MENLGSRHRSALVIAIGGLLLVSLLAGCFVFQGTSQLTLTVGDDGNGSTDPSGDLTVLDGDATDISATADSGFGFTSWTVESGSAEIADPAAVSTTVTLTTVDATIRANFQALEYGLTVSNDGNGSTVPSGSVTAVHGIAQDIVATPDPGFTFTGWTVESGSAVITSPSSASTTITLTGNAQIRATFALTPMAYVANYDDNTVSVVNGITGAVPTTVTVGTQPAAVAANRQTGKVYVVHFDGEIQVIDGSTNSVVGTIPAPASGNDYPSVAVDTSTNTVFAATQYDSDVYVVDGSTDTLSGTFFNDYSNYAGTYPTGMAVNSTTGKLYISDWGDSTLYVYNATTYALITSLSVDPNEKGGVAINPVTNRIYVSNAGTADSVSVVDGSTDTELTAVTVGAYPSGLAVNTLTNTIYVANTNDDTVSVIDGGTNTVVTTIGVGNAPIGVALSETFDLVYVVNSLDGTVSIIDGETNSVTDTVTVGANPQFIGVLE